MLAIDVKQHDFKICNSTYPYVYADDVKRKLYNVNAFNGFQMITRSRGEHQAIDYLHKIMLFTSHNRNIQIRNIQPHRRMGTDVATTT